MATTGIVKGLNFNVFLSEDSGVTYDQIAHAKSCNMTLQTNEIDTSDKDDGLWTDFLDGKKTWTMNVDGLFTFDAETDKDQAIDLMALQIAGTVVKIQFSTAVSGDTQYTGDALIINTDVSADDENATTYSVSFKGKGALAPTTVS